MTDFLSDSVLPTIVMSTVRLVLATAIAIISLRAFVRISPPMHRWLWTLVLCQSFLVIPIVVELAILPAESVPHQQTTELASHNEIPAGLPNNSATFVSNDLQNWDFQSVLGWLWLVGCLGTLLFLILSLIVVRRVVRASSSARDEWQSQFDSIRQQIPGAQTVKLKVHPTCGPLLAYDVQGISLAPCIIIPRGLWPELSAFEREAVLRHEFAHYQRGDLWRSLLVRLAATVHWFNPIAWWLSNRFDEAAEWACDQMVRSNDERLGTALASSLLRVSKPSAFARFAASTARGSRVGIRVRRLLGKHTNQEPNMKNYLVMSLIVLAVAISTVRFRAIAQESDSRARGGNPAIRTQLVHLAQNLAQSDTELEQLLSKTLLSQAGTIVLEDFLRQRIAEKQADSPDTAFEAVLGDYFNLTSKPPQLRADQSDWRAEILAIADRADNNIQGLAIACSKLAAELQGKDETTLLVKRFLSSETGPEFLYLAQLHDRMTPGPAMLGDGFGRLVARASNGKYQIRPDAREQVAKIVELAPRAQKLTGRLRESLSLWANELVNDAYHQRVRKLVTDPMFAAFIIAKQIFEKKQLNANIVLEVPDQLDKLSQDTSQGLEIREAARDEVEIVLAQFETLSPRINRVRPILNDFILQLDTSNVLEREFAEALGEDFAAAGISEGAQIINASPDDLVRTLLAQALDQSSDGIRLTSNSELLEEIENNIQNAFRDWRSMRRRTAPLRELATDLEDSELATAMRSMGTVLFIKQAIDQKQREAAEGAVQEWVKESFESTEDGLRVRDALRPKIEVYLNRVAEIESELAEDDF